MAQISSFLISHTHSQQYSLETHVQISIILLNLIFQLWLLSIFWGIFIEEFGSVIRFAVRVWSWKLWLIKGSLAFGAAIRGSVDLNIVLRRVIKTSRSTARCFDDSTQHDV